MKCRPTKDEVWNDAVKRWPTKDEVWNDAVKHRPTKDEVWNDAMKRRPTKDEVVVSKLGVSDLLVEGGARVELSVADKTGFVDLSTYLEKKGIFFV